MIAALRRRAVSPRASAELRLLAGDALAIIAAVAFAGRIGDYDNIGLPVVLVAWSVVPRLLCPGVSWLRRPKTFLETLMFSTAIVSVTGFLIFVGIDVLIDSRPPQMRPDHWSLVMIVMTWILSFFLYHPPWYRAHEVLLLGTLVVGMLAKAPHPVAAVLVFTVGYVVSTTSRHLLHTIHVGTRHERLELRATRAFSLFAIVLAGGYYSALYFGFDSLIPYRTDATSIEPGAGDAMTALPAPADGQWASDDANGNGGESSRVALANHVRLGDVQRRTFDPRIACEVTYLNFSDATRWRATPSTLWRVVTMAGPERSWGVWGVREGEEERAWSARSSIVTSPRAARLPQVPLEARIIDDQLRGLIAPYWTSSYAGMDFGADRTLRMSEAGTWLVEPPLDTGERYIVSVVPDREFDEQATRYMQGPTRRLDRAALNLVPATSEIGIDLRGLAARIFGDASTFAEKVARLEDFFAAQYHYERDLSWSAPERQRLAAFLGVHRTGDCNYYAISSALLLRAAGLSTRVAGGFLGAEYDRDRLCFRLIHGTAHAWAEYYLPGVGWVPVDATAWVSSVPGTAIASESGDEVPADPISANDDGDASEAAGADESSGSHPSRDVARSSDRGTSRRDDIAAERSADTPRSTASEVDASQFLVPAVFGEEGEAVFASHRDPTDADDPSRAGLVHSRSTGRGQSEGASQPEIVANLRSLVLRLFLLIVAGLAAVLAIRTAIFPPRADGDDEDDSAEDEESDELAQRLEEWAPPGMPETPAQIIVFEYRRMQSRLARRRRQRRAAETPLAHALRVRGKREAVDVAFAELVECLYATLYSHHEATASEASKARAACRVIEKALG